MQACWKGNPAGMVLGPEPRACTVICGTKRFGETMAVVQQCFIAPREEQGEVKRPATLSLSLILTQILCIHKAIMRFSDAVPK